MSNCNSCKSCSKKRTYDNDEPFRLNVKVQAFPSPFDKNKISMNVIHGPTGLIVNGSGYNRLVLQRELFNEMNDLLEEYSEYGSIEDSTYYTSRNDCDY